MPLKQIMHKVPEFSDKLHLLEVREMVVIYCDIADIICKANGTSMQMLKDVVM